MPLPFSSIKAKCQDEPEGQIHQIEDEFGENMPEMGPPKGGLRPPSFETLFNNVKMITKKYEVVKGFRFELSGSLSNRFHMVHTWNIPYKTLVPRGKPPKVGTYSITTQYLLGEVKTYYDDPKLIMTGKMESSGKLETGIIKKLTDSLTLRFSSAYPSDVMTPPQLHLDVDHEGKDSTSNFKLGSGFLAFNTMQAIGKRLALGFEVFNIHMGEKRTEFSYAARYKNDNHMLLAQYHGLQSSFNLAYGMNVRFP